MKLKSRPRFDPDTLGDLAGDKMFVRGEAYFRDGSVEILDLDNSRVLARVAGTEDYRTVVLGQSTGIAGECSCPAFAREGFCKHIVAVALAANAAATSGEDDSSGTFERVRAYLKTRDADALVTMIMDVAERDPALLRKLELAAAAVGADDKVLDGQLRKALRDATRTRGFVDYGRVAARVADVDAVLDMLSELASGSRAAIVVGLADYAISRIEKETERIDDSGGYGGALLARAQTIHLDACRAARPEPVALARYLFQRETEGYYDTFYAAAAHYADVLGEDGLAEYRRLAQEAWDELPSRVGAHRSAQPVPSVHLASILDFFAERDGDVEMRIALRAKNLSSPSAYLRLAEFCLEQGRPAEALSRAEEGLWIFEDDRPDERLVLFAVDMLVNAGRNADAEAHLWRAFGKEPSLNLYGRLRELGGEAALERAVELLEKRLGGEQRSLWHSPADLLVRIMIEEKMFEPAWNIVRRHGASRGVTEALARASEATHPKEALALYAERVEDLAKTGGNLAYKEAVELISRMAPLRGATEQAAYIAELKERHGRKRNFMKLLG